MKGQLWEYGLRNGTSFSVSVVSRWFFLIISLLIIVPLYHFKDAALIDKDLQAIFLLGAVYCGWDSD